MPAIENSSPFAVQVFAGFDSTAREQMVAVLGASFEARPGEMPQTVEPLEIDAIDRHRTDPVTSSVVYPGQSGFAKPMTDVIVIGSAYAPNGRAVESMSVGVRVGHIEKILRVSGDRFWRPGVAGQVPSSPRPFRVMPIIYERAFGGGAVPPVDGSAAYDERNPIGVGLPGCTACDPSIQTEVPNVEYPGDLIATRQHRPVPAGYGPLSMNCRSRLAFAGTYDDAWLKAQAPLLPMDFDPRFHQVAPPDQQAGRLRANDRIDVAGMTPEGRWTTSIPAFDTTLTLLYADRIERTQAVVDTIQLEPDKYRIHLTARLQLPVIRNRAPLHTVVVGELRRGRLRARYSGKFYRPHIGVSD